MARGGVLIFVVAAAALAAAAAFAAQSPKALRRSMFAAARQQHSVHYVEVGVAQSQDLHQRMVGDVAGGRGIQRVSFRISGKKGHFTVRVVKRIAYLRADIVALHDYFGFSGAQSAHFRGHWVAIRPSSSLYKPLASSVTLPSFLRDIYPRKPLALVRSKIHGRRITGVRGLNREPGVHFIEAVYPDRKLRPLEVADYDPKQAFVDGIEISRWNEPVHVKAPAHSVSGG